ncbi:GNAT family N-acetyltransferase [Paenarthrobacter sp. Z7-10]|uniref:GNAT family N-acetyltransferase n=1 Tax=Paenarthrobacter sp. Z7-10 TaxID=2787635 RepID=UPI0022A987C3|nr:GNAT family N-acetyltransferase [Paenarthrobacter sp. Z7-10]
MAADIPELTIGMLPDHRGAGTGTALMTALLALARSHGLRAISLSVEDGNRARALYDRLGFVKVGRNGGSDTLLVRLAPQS